MPRKPYNFKQEKTTGETKFFSPSRLISAGSTIYSTIPESGMFMCPYTEFIPLLYLLTTTGWGGVYQNIAEEIRKSWKVRNNNPNKLAKFRNRWGGKIITIFPSSVMGYSRQGMREHTNRSIQEWLERDQICNMSILGSKGHCSYRDQIHAEWKDNQVKKYAQNTYSGAIAPYSLFLNKEDRGVQTPYMLAVIAPENYLYVKHHLLVHNTIPLDRVIVLIDKDLDRGDFPNAPFKRLYRELLPKVMQSSCQVWKVPRQFIDDYCFLDSYKIKSTNILERKKEIDGVIEQFYETFRSGSGAQTATPPLASIAEAESWANSVLTTGGAGNVLLEDTETWTWSIPPTRNSSATYGIGSVPNRLGTSLVDGMRAQQIMYNVAMNQLGQTIGVDPIRERDIREGSAVFNSTAINRRLDELAGGGNGLRMEEELEF